MVRLVPLNERAENSINIMNLNRDELNDQRGERWFELDSTVTVFRAHGVPEKKLETTLNPIKKILRNMLECLDIFSDRVNLWLIDTSYLLYY